MPAVTKSLNLRLIATTVYRMVREDPVFFALQVTRKMPAKVRRILGKLGTKLPSSSLAEFLQLIADIPVEVRHASALAEEMKVLRGHAPSPTARPATRARYAYAMGDITGAINLLPAGSALARRYADERRILLGDAFVLPPNGKLTGVTGEGIDALHVLVNSAPHTSSGYTVRTRAILAGQRQRGMKVAGVTRIAYPITIGVFAPNPVDTVDEISYYRLLPKTLPESPIDRLHKHATMLSDVVAKLRPRILHATTNYTNAVVAKAVAEAHGIPWVYEMRGQLEKTWVARHRPEVQSEVAASERYRLMVDKETAMAQAADAVVVLSQVQRDDLITRGIPAEKIHIIPNAFTPGEAAPLSRDVAKRQLGLPAEFTVGTVTSVVDYEGLDTLIRAIELLKERGLSVRCVIVGDGVSRPALMKLAGELGVEDLVYLPGKVSREASHTWYQALDLFAVPRKDTLVCRTITPIKPIEAMSLGTPVVASDLPPLREIIGPGGVACTPEDPVAFADAIEKLATDADHYADLGLAGKEHAAGYTWDRNMNRYVDLYEQITNDQPGDLQ